MNKLTKTTMMLAAGLLLGTGAMAQDQVDGGTCGAEGNNLTWKLTSNDILIISGAGAMANYSLEWEAWAPWFYHVSQIKTVVIGEQVTSIGEQAFSCIGITSVTIPSSVTSIGESAFGACGRLTSVVIPSSITSIGESAFANCEKLTSVTIPSSVTSIGERVFDGCGELTAIHVEDGNARYASEDGVLFSKDKTTLVQYPAGKQGSYTIPGSVTSIGGWAFAGCNGLTSVTIPGSVTSIGKRAFFACHKLASVAIPSNVISIGEGAFAACFELTSTTIPSSVTSIGNGPFASCNKLTAINVEANNTRYSTAAGVLFCNDSATLVQYPAGKQGDYSIPSGTTSIGESAFSGCNGLTAIAIPNSITGIGERAFYGCDELTSVTIPCDVTSIGMFAVNDCHKLKSITNLSLLPQAIHKYAFPFHGKNTIVLTLYVPEGSVAAYEAAEVWKNFASIEAAP